jgi:hypothetical protein
MKINLIIGAAISALSIYYLATRIDATELLEALKGANLLPLIPAVLINFVAIWVRAWRWKYLLKPVGEVRVESLFFATVSGFMVNMILPGRLGEFLRAHLVGEREEVNKLSSLATIVVERLIDSFCILAILVGILIVFISGNAAEVSAGVPTLIYYGTGAAAILVGILILLLVLRSRREWARKFFSPLMKVLPQNAGQRFERMVDAFLDGLNSLKKSRSLATVIIISVPLWALAAFFNYLIISSFGITLPVYGYFFLIITQAFGVVIPAPGYIGTYHLATSTGLFWLGVGEAQALSLAIVMHASFFIPLIVVGLIYWWLGGFSLRGITKDTAFELTS